jgi:putative MATE family efflux protein
MVVGHERVGAALIRLALPIALALVADQFLGIADTIVVGTLGPSALAAIAGATSVFATIAIAMFAFSSGPRIMGAQAIGAGDPLRFGRIVRASFVVPGAIALAVMVAAAYGSHALLHAMLPHVAAVDQGALYLALRAASLLPFVGSGILLSSFGAAGDTSPALRTLIVINVVHIPLLVVLALGLGTHHPLGLVGAGISSLVSELVGFAFCVATALRRPELGIFRDRAISLPFVRATALLSLPEFVFLFMLIVPEPITIALLAPYGDAVVAGFRALTLVSDATWSIPGSIGEATEIVIGQRIGARDYAGARAFQGGATRLGVTIGGAVGLGVAALSWPLTAVVTFNAAIAAIAFAPLAVHACLLPLKVYAMTTLAPIRASGDVRFTMWMGVFTSGLAIAGITLGILVMHIGLWSVPFGWAVAWLVRCAITTVRLRSGNWERRTLAA